MSSTSVSPTPAGRPVPPPAGGGDVLRPRVVAALIDLAIVGALFVVVVALTGGVGSGDGVTPLLDDAALVAYLVLAFLYFAVSEAALARTVGKALVGLRVVGWQGDRPSVVAVVLRTILRVVDFLPVLYVVGFISMLVTGPRRRRLGDLVAETAVERTTPSRHRGLYGTLLAAVLFGAVALSVASSAGSGGLVSDGSSSSACVFDRCNATANGDQVMELSGHVVAVGDIGGAADGSGASARATFTVAGHAVVLRVGETRAVGPSLVHLASVEGDVAKFSIDFSGLYLQRADLGEASGVEMSTYPSYTAVTDDRGVVTVEVPADWDDVDRREDAEYGPGIRAAADLDEFGRVLNVPGIAVHVSTQHGADDIGTVLNQVTRPAGQCTSAGREAYDDRRHSGEIERWTGCDDADTTIVVAALAPADDAFLLRIVGHAVGARDLAALDRALGTVDVSTSSAAPADTPEPAETGAPQAPIAGEADWIEQVKALRAEIDTAIGFEDEELTAAVLTRMSTAMRRCSRTLAAAPPDPGVQRLRELVQAACAEYDEGADCLATAAGIDDTAGSAGQRRMSEALDCGLAGLNRGGDRLIDAEIEADDLQPVPPG